MNRWLAARHLLTVRLNNSGKPAIASVQASGMGGSK